MWIVCLMSLACASAQLPPTGDSVDWQAIDERWSFQVVTVDPDGDERVTRIWIVRVDGGAAIRTGESRWWHNLERDPRIRVRLSGTDHPLRVEFVTEQEDKIRIDEVFLEKYGGWERVLFPQERGKTHENYAWIRP